MNKETVSRDYKKRVDKVINFILKNMNDDLSLERLAKISNFSPFHFQRIFKEVVGASPKQYIIKLRLETAIHLLIIHPQKSIFEISGDCGFSSPSVFSRSFKNHFGIPPEEIHHHSLRSIHSIRKDRNMKMMHDSNPDKSRTDQSIEISIRKLEGFFGIHLLAPFGDLAKIEKCFGEIRQLVETHDLETDGDKLYGILSPHQGNVYKTLIAIKKGQNIPEHLFTTEIKPGKYAVFKVKGGFSTTLEAGKQFYHDWLSGSGYKIADILGFESFADNPAKFSYEDIEREIFIPVEPK